jgi:hypothetical protein
MALIHRCREAVLLLLLAWVSCEVSLAAGDEDLHLSADSTGSWPCEPKPSHEEGGASIPLERPTTLRGRLQMPESQAGPPASVRLRLERPGQPEKSVDILACGRATIEVTCAVARDRRFECPVPAGVVDLRATVGGFIPFYFWGLRLEPEGHFDLGTLRLRRGASVVGYVSGLSEISPAARVVASRVRLGGGNPEEELKASRTDVDATADERGFFQLAGLPAGELQLTALAGDRVAALREVTLTAAEELVLSEPLELMAPLEATFFVEPPTAPGGGPWTAALLREHGGRLFGVQEKPCSLQGTVALGGLRPGSYRLELQDDTGSVWHNEKLDLLESRAHFIEMTLVEVRGRLLVGDQGRPGRVVFGANQVPRLVLAADEEGAFEGFLPREGEWPLLVEWPSGERRKLPPLEIRRRSGKRWAEIEVALPSTTIRGQVTKEGKKIAASVLIRAFGRDELASSLVAQEGEFEFLGLEPGRYEVAAVDRQERSAWLEVEVRRENEAPFIQLEIGASKEAKGLLRHGGQPVPGAQIAASASHHSNEWEGTLRSISLFDGGFSLRIPRHLDTLDLLVTAPGLPLWLGRIRFDDKVPAVIDLASASGDLYFPVDEPSEWVARFGQAEIGLGSLLRFLAQLHGGYRQRDADHAYLASGLPTGLWNLCSSLSGECTSALLTPGATLELHPPRSSR